MTQAWRESEREKYHIDEDPRAFVNQITCSYSATEQKFPDDNIPSREKLIKKILYRGLPPKSIKYSELLSGWRAHLNKFIELVENEQNKVPVGKWTESVPVFSLSVEQNSSKP